MASAKKSVIAAVIADLAIAVVKFLGGALTGSAVMVAEGVHSVVDGANASLLLLGQKRAARPPNEQHPFGYAREVYFWTIIVAMVAFVLGGGFAAVQGVMALKTHEHGGVWPNYLILGVAFAFDGTSLTIALREFGKYRREKRYEGGFLSVVRQSHNPPIFVTVLEDMAALTGVVIAAVGITLSHFLHQPAFDAAAAILDGALLMAMAVLLGWEAHGLIVGEAARGALVADARRIIEATDGVGRIERLRTLQLGPEAVLLVLGARWRDGIPVGELGRVSRDLEARLQKAHPSIRHVVFDFAV